MVQRATELSMPRCPVTQSTRPGQGVVAFYEMVKPGSHAADWPAPGGRKRQRAAARPCPIAVTTCSFSSASVWIAEPRLPNSDMMTNRRSRIALFSEQDTLRASEESVSNSLLRSERVADTKRIPGSKMVVSPPENLKTFDGT